MKIRIYINEKDKIMCHIPGEQKDMLFIEFAMGVGLGNADKIKELLVAQVTGSVRWTESVSYMQMKGVTDFVECGNGKVLTGLIKRIAPDARLLNIGSKDQVEQALSFF